MSETRYMEVYDGKGNLLERTPYVVSDAELKKEKAIELIQKLKTKGKLTWKSTDILNLLEAILELLF